MSDLPVTVNVFCCGRQVTLPQTNLSLVVVMKEGEEMATVTANWTPSASAGVTSQTLTWTVNGSVQPPLSLGPATTTAQFIANAGDSVSVSLFATGPGGNSPPVTASVQVPVAPPLPPTNLTLTVGP